MIGVKVSGSFSNTESYLKRLKNSDTKVIKVLNKYGKIGVERLSVVTPVDTGLTASSWYYKIETKNGSHRLLFCNSNIQNGIPIAMILDTGHATRNGGWVQGRNYIYPTLTPIFEKIAKEVWQEVTKL